MFLCLRAFLTFEKHTVEALARHLAKIDRRPPVCLCDVRFTPRPRSASHVFNTAPVHVRALYALESIVRPPLGLVACGATTSLLSSLGPVLSET